MKVASRKTVRRFATHPAKNKYIQNIELMLKSMGLPYEKEFVFHPTRKFRFDFAIPLYKIAIEYEGGIFFTGRHQQMAGYANDCEKYNLATSLGWRILRFTAVNFQKKQADVPVLIGEIIKNAGV